MERLSGTSRLHAIKARLIIAVKEKRREETQTAREVTQEVRQGTQKFAESCGEAFQASDMLATHADF